MDSRLLYSKCVHLDRIVSWDDEWIHFGTGKELRFDIVQKIITDFLIEEELYFVHTRTDSGEKNRAELLEEIHEYLGKEKFHLWNLSMDKVIRFDNIGVLLLGRIVK